MHICILLSHICDAALTFAEKAASRPTAVRVGAGVSCVSRVGTARAEDAQKLLYAEAAVSSLDPFANEAVVDTDVLEVWYHFRPAISVIRVL